MTEVESSAPRVIKRYPNRKLYDTQKSCYVTLDEIANMVKEGQDVQIIDNKTNQDITSVTLTQIIFEEEKKNKSILPLSALKKIIQSGQEALKSRFNESAERVSHLREETEKQIQRLLNRSELTAEETRNLLTDFFMHRQKNLEDLQKSLDDRIRHYVERVFGGESASASGEQPLTEADYQHKIAQLQSKIDELEARIEELSSEEASLED